MKSKVFMIGAIMATAGFAATAFAAGAGVSTEYEYEHGKGAFANSQAVSVAPFYKFDNGVKADVKLEASRDSGRQANGDTKPIETLIEARVRKDFEVYPNTTVGVRIGVGEHLNGIARSGATTDFAYYTIEPIATYAFTDKITGSVSYRYRNAFSTSKYDYKTNTGKIGVAYKLSDKDEVGVKYFEKYGDVRSNGIEVGYTRKF